MLLLFYIYERYKNCILLSFFIFQQKKKDARSQLDELNKILKPVQEQQKVSAGEQELCTSSASKHVADFATINRIIGTTPNAFIKCSANPSPVVYCKRGGL